MTTALPYRADWRTAAACAGRDTRTFFTTNPAPAKAICGRCPVRAECLHDALTHETYFRFGIWGGLTAPQRQALATGLPEEPVTIQALRDLLDEIDAQGGPQAARDNRLHLPDAQPTERTEPMDTTTETTPAKPTAQAAAEALPVSSLLAWGDEHPDTDIQDQAARGRAILTGLRKRYAADQELTAITTEAEQLEKRLAELRAREAELASAKAKTPRRKIDLGYDSRAVRAWAREAGVDCPATGRVPKAIVDQWKAATSPAGDGSS